MKLYCGCSRRCTCREAYYIPYSEPNENIAPVDINLTRNPTMISRSTQTNNSEYADDVVDRLRILKMIYSHDREKIRILKDLQTHILN